MSVISLYTGVGGLDFGFEAAGLETSVAIEMDDICCKTISMNRNWRIMPGDIHGFSSEEILKKANLRVGEADVLIGGPPCQPFSKSGFWASGESKRLDDPRSSTLEQYLRVLRDTSPRAFLLENVPGIGFSKKSEGLDLLLSGIDVINKETGTNYQPVVAKLNAASFGVPQMRERVFMIAGREGQGFVFPSPTHFSPDDENAPENAEPYRTTWDALGDLPQNRDDDDLKLCGKWAELLQSIPEGENYLWHTPRGGGLPLFGWRTRYWSFLLKLAKNRPSWTIQAQPGPSTGPFHWKNRYLATEELCRLQTFPDDLRFTGSRRDVQRMLGNAVPSLLAEILAREIRRQVLGDTIGMPAALQLIPRRRERIPRRERVKDVPSQYLRLVDDHDEHPGAGLGPGARRRVNA